MGLVSFGVSGLCREKGLQTIGGVISPSKDLVGKRLTIPCKPNGGGGRVEGANSTLQRRKEFLKLWGPFSWVLNLCWLFRGLMLRNSQPEA